MVAFDEGPQQLVFDLPHRAAMDEEDFLVSDCNESAVKVIDIWPDWHHPSLLIVGPQGCGKTHLAYVWQMKTGAAMLSAAELTSDMVDNLAQAPAVIIEDIDAGPFNQNALFHLLNLAKERSFNVLMTGRERPGTWEIELPDLRSRLRASPVVEIEAPDELLLNTVLVKLFSDRQLIVPPNVIKYISLRMERSMSAAQKLVEKVDKAALASGRKVTRQLVGEVMN
ncbi:MAG: HdaA/DnaA family protein [Methyloligellaceae bacterium]